MLFPSQVFLFYFLPLTLLLYYLSPKPRRRLFLTLASLVFYGWWDWRFIGLLLALTGIDYFCGHQICVNPAPRLRKLFLILSLSANLCLLGFFKYFMFAGRALAEALVLFGGTRPEALLAIQVALPVGISFYTFQSMSYTIDIYRREQQPARSLVDFACYGSMFPQLVAGPIVRYSAIADQLRKPFVSLERLNLGFQFFLFGLAKKVLLADTVAPPADRFSNAAQLSGMASVDALQF